MFTSGRKGCPEAHMTSVRQQDLGGRPPCCSCSSGSSGPWPMGSPLLWEWRHEPTPYLFGIKIWRVVLVHTFPFTLESKRDVTQRVPQETCSCSLTGWDLGERGEGHYRGERGSRSEKNPLLSLWKTPGGSDSLRAMAFTALWGTMAYSKTYLTLQSYKHTRDTAEAQVS